MTTEITNLLASRFIQRKDVKAVQKGDAYYPDRSRWTRADLEAHVSGEKSFGHYLVDTESQCKLFAFDIDLMKWDEGRSTRSQPTWVPIDGDGYSLDTEPKPLQPRDAWHHPKAPPELRRFLIAQMRGVADMFATLIADLGIDVAVSYSGSKGMHVYGFTGTAPAHDVRGAAMDIIDIAGCFEPLRGKNFFRHISDDPRTGHGCIEVEVFPKQSNLDDKDLGNLLRLPLGTHAKSGNRAYFVTLNSNIDELVELDPIVALEGENPWR